MMTRQYFLNSLNNSVLVVKTHEAELKIEPDTVLLETYNMVVSDLQPDMIPVEEDRGKTSSAINQDRDEAAISSAKNEDSSKYGGGKSSDKKDRYEKSEHLHRGQHRSGKHRHRRSAKESLQSLSMPEKSGSTNKNHSSCSDGKDHHYSWSKRSRSRRRHKHRSGKRMEKTAVAVAKPTAKNAVHLADMQLTDPYCCSPGLLGYAWKGTINIPFMGKVHVMLKEVSGNCEGLDKDLPPVIEMVGRLRPDVMWQYISDVKKAGLEVLVLQFEVQDEMQYFNYLSMYSYLSRNKRMGVLGSNSPGIKDFYVMTIGRSNSIPEVLLPLDRPGFEDNRSCIMLGIIVRTRRKRHSTKVSQLARCETETESAAM